MQKAETRIIPEETNPKFFAEHLKPYEFLRHKAIEKSILEVGCGDGYGGAYLAQAASQVVCVDYDEVVVLKAQSKYKAPNLQFVSMEAGELQFQDNSFDFVCSFQVIEHIPEDSLLWYLSEIKRVLKKGGELYLSTLNLEHTMKSPKTYHKQPAHCKEFKLDELSQLLSKVFINFEIYGLHLTSKHSFFLWLKRVGILNFLPDSINPVKRFYENVSTGDFKITKANLRKAIDFVCICGK